MGSMAVGGLGLGLGEPVAGPVGVLAAGERVVVATGEGVSVDPVAVAVDPGTVFVGVPSSHARRKIMAIRGTTKSALIMVPPWIWHRVASVNY
jgi:hypothetical protein